MVVLRSGVLAHTDPGESREVGHIFADCRISVDSQ